MAYREGDRCQMMLLPPVIEEYVRPRDPVRAYDAMIDAIDIDQLGLYIDPDQVGNPAYAPISMLKLLVYGYSYGWHSSRKLERACYHNLSFIWLMGGLKPDHKTIANFRKNNKEVLKNVLRETAHICLEMDLIEGNCLFTDSSKIRGAASINQTLTKKGWEEKLAEAGRSIEDLLAKCDEIDEAESGALVELQEDLADKIKLQSKIKGLIEKMGKEKLKKINGTDNDCVNFKGRQGSHAGYSAHITVDEKNGLIVNADVVAAANDSNQFSGQVEQAVEVLGKSCKTVVADSGYSSVDDIKQITDKHIDVIVPNQQQALHRPKDEPFGKDKFHYDSENNQYICPEGKLLRYSHFSKQKGHYLYRMETASLCRECRYWGICTSSRRGRAIIRLKDEELKKRLEGRYASEEGQTIYKKRKEKIELVFGHIKRNLNGGAFLVRGLSAVRAEWALFASCFNITRMITITGGVEELIKRLALEKSQPREILTEFKGVNILKTKVLIAC
jgi:transposase